MISSSQFPFFKVGLQEVSGIAPKSVSDLKPNGPNLTVFTRKYIPFKSVTSTLKLRGQFYAEVNSTEDNRAYRQWL